ncbi:O-antigen polymerase [Edwardsiella tarda]|uniref:O-antigen polymerase n=1 Tax=Edwardsiella tarda TaxID=636 RepID=UPI0011B22F13|nr:O-antigen polymerase [Edwardsiella tarda]UCQ10402.1 oligosaccharide repeat unit polymerase [Edwardsiella tarda]
MTNQDYAIHLLYPNIFTFFIIFIFVFLFFYAWFHKNIYSLFDPFLLAIIFSAAGLSTVIFLYVEGEIKDNYIIQTLLSQLMLMLGYKLLSRNERYCYDAGSNPNIIRKKTTALTTCFFVTSILFLLSQSLTYILLGIPLFLDSRLMIYQSGGFGILGRIVDVTFVISFYTFIDMKLRYENMGFSKFYGVVYFLFLIVSLFLNGSKSGVLNLVFIIGIFCHLNRLKFNINLYDKYSKFIITMFVVSVLAMFLILMFNYGVFSGGDYNRIFDLVGVIFLRIFNSGDIYVLGYPNDAMFSIVNTHNGFIALFKDFLATFRIIQDEQIPPSLGNIIFNLYHSTGIGGANARQSAFGYYYYGFIGSLLFSFSIGLLMSFVRHTLPRVKSSPLFLAFTCYFILNYSFFDVDPSYQLSKITNFTIVFFIVIVLYFLMPRREGRSNV